MDNKSLLKISERFESLGHNCEIGFALRKLGNEDGQIFRWAEGVSKLGGDGRPIADFRACASRQHQTVMWRGWTDKAGLAAS